jgi:hypothetical protein
MARHLLTAVALLIFLGACAPKTNMIDDRTAIVSGRTSEVDGRGTMTTAMLREAAKQCLDRGFAYFQVLSDVDRSGTMASATAAPTTSPATGGASAVAPPGPMTGGAAQVPRGGIMVRFYKAGEINPNAPGVWNARALVAARS